MVNRCWRPWWVADSYATLAMHSCFVGVCRCMRLQWCFNRYGCGRVHMRVVAEMPHQARKPTLLQPVHIAGGPPAPKRPSPSRAAGGCAAATTTRHARRQQQRCQPTANSGRASGRRSHLQCVTPDQLRILRPTQPQFAANRHNARQQQRCQPPAKSGAAGGNRICRQMNNSGCLACCRRSHNWHTALKQ